MTHISNEENNICSAYIGDNIIKSLTLKKTYLLVKEISSKERNKGFGDMAFSLGIFPPKVILQVNSQFLKILKEILETLILFVCLLFYFCIFICSPVLSFSLIPISSSE